MASCLGCVKVEVLGGQHTVLALKSLVGKRLVAPHVRTVIYANLDSALALKVGLHHNLISEKSRPMTFIETVKMMRGRRPSNQSKTEIKKWKQELLIIFGDKSLELMEGRLQNYIALARVGENVWKCILEAEEMFGDLQQTVFKGMTSLPEDKQIDLMRCLLDNGLKEFKAKMRDFKKKYPARKRQVQRKENITTAMDRSDEMEQKDDHVEDSGKKVEAYILEIDSLRTEVEMLRERLQKEKDASENCEPNAKKTKRDDDDEIVIGDHVMAYWANDDNMYEAVVLNIETVYSVQYVLDNKKKKLGRQQLKRSKNLQTLPKEH